MNLERILQQAQVPGGVALRVQGDVSSLKQQARDLGLVAEDILIDGNCPGVHLRPPPDSIKLDLPRQWEVRLEVVYPPGSYRHSGMKEDSRLNQELLNQINFYQDQWKERKDLLHIHNARFLVAQPSIKFTNRIFFGATTSLMTEKGLAVALKELQKYLKKVLNPKYGIFQTAKLKFSTWEVKEKREE